MSTERLEEQVKRLAGFIMEELPGEPSENEGAVDTAIRLLRATKRDPEKDTFSFEEAEYIEAKAANLSKFALNQTWIATYKQLAEAAYALKTGIDRATVK